MTWGHRGSLLLRCRAFSSLSSCRFIPALSPRSRGDRLTGAVPSSSPAASPRVRRRPSPWPPATPEIRRGSKSPPPGQTVGVRCIPARIHQVGAGDSLTGIPPLVHSSLHLPVVLARPEPSGGAGPSCRCQGCSRRLLGLQQAAALSFAVLLRQARRWSPFTSTRSSRASWRTFRRNRAWPLSPAPGWCSPRSSRPVQAASASGKPILGEDASGACPSTVELAAGAAMDQRRAIKTLLSPCPAVRRGEGTGDERDD